MRHIDTIIFDAEGVVIDTEGLWDAAQRDFLAELGHIYDRAKLKPLLAGRTSHDGMQLLKEALGLPGDPDDLAAARLEHATRHFDDVALMEGFSDFYARVAPQFKTGLATAMDPTLFELIEARLGLDALFAGHVVTVADVEGRGKPAPDLFLRAAALLRSAPHSCIVIEDSPNGIEAARNAGMTCIGIATTFDRELLGDAQLVVDTFSEIDVEHLDELVRPNQSTAPRPRPAAPGS